MLMLPYPTTAGLGFDAGEEREGGRERVIPVVHSIVTDHDKRVGAAAAAAEDTTAAAVAELDLDRPRLF